MVVVIDSFRLGECVHMDTKCALDTGEQGSSPRVVKIPRSEQLCGMGSAPKPVEWMQVSKKKNKVLPLFDEEGVTRKFSILL